MKQWRDRIWKSGLAVLALAVYPITLGQAQQTDRGLDFAATHLSPGSAIGSDPHNLYTGSYAVIIGISHYQDSSKNLTYADADATTLRDLLVKSYDFPADHITLLLNEQATKGNIEKALSKLADGTKIKETDRILIFFSGHGQTVKNRDGEMGFLIPTDADVDLAHPEDRSGYLASCLPMNNVWEYLSASPARHALLIADACYGGLLVKSRAFAPEAPSAPLLSNLLARPSLEALTAGGAGESVVENPEWGHGALTYKLLEELRAQAATPGSVFLASQLASTLKTAVGNITGGRQTPQFGSHDSTEGDFIFYTTDPKKMSTSATGGHTIFGGNEGRTAFTALKAEIPTLLTSALAAAHAINDEPSKSLALSRVAAVQALTGDIGGAKAVAETIQSEGSRAGALCDVASAQIKIGDMTGARATLLSARTVDGSVEDPEEKAYGLSKIAVEQALAGDKAGARETFKLAKSFAESVSNPSLKSSALIDMVARQAQAGNVAEAKATVREIDDVSSRTSALCTIAFAQVKAGDVMGAESTVRDVEDEQDKVSVLSDIAEAQINAGDRLGAKETLRLARSLTESISDPSLKPNALLNIARAEIKTGDLAKARETLQSAGVIARAMENGEFILSAISTEQAEAGDVSGAKSSAQAISNSRVRVMVLIRIATTQAATQALAGDTAGARETLESAKSIAESVRIPTQKSSALSDIAVDQALAGDTAGARETLGSAKSIAEANSNPSSRCLALTRIVETLEKGETHSVPDKP